MRNFFRENKILLVILTGAFLVSLAYAFYFRIAPAVDARAYDTIAQNIVAGVGYREELNRDIAADQAITRVGPLYEYFLAGLYKIFGHHREIVWLAQAVLHSLTAWLVYLIAGLIFFGHQRRKIIGLFSAGLIGFYPDLIEISAMLMTETLYLFLICLMIYVFFVFFRRPAGRPDDWLAAALGLTAGLAVLGRPPVFFLLPVVLFYFWRAKLWRQAAVFLAVLLIVFTPWTVRNFRVYHQFMPFGNSGTINFWIGNYHGADGEQGLTEEQMEFESSHSIKEIGEESIRQFKVFIISHPLEFIKLTLLRINKYFSVIRPMGFWFYQQGLGQLLFILSSALASVILFVFGLAGILKAIARREEKLYYLIALAVFTPLILFITVVETRYRFQIYPLLAVLAAYFLAEKRDWWAWRRDRALRLAAVLVFTNGLVDLLLSLDRFKERLGGFF